MIKFENVSFSYDKDMPIIENLSFSIQNGESVGLIGANGAGKSTIMKILLGLLPCEGRVSVDDLPVEKKNLPDIRKKLGFLLQNSDNQMFMPTVYEDMMFGPRNYCLSKEEAEQQVDRILNQLGLTDLKHRYNHKISGGEKRMAAIATILAMQPETILMDEPSMGLSPLLVKEIFSIIKEVHRQGITVLLVEQNAKMALSIADRAYVLETGHITLTGTGQELLNNENVKKAYLGA